MRLVRTTFIKTTVWILIIIELWLLLQVPAVGNAFFSFIVGGEVPGTSKILSLNEMILFLTGLFVLAVSLLFHREINLLLGGTRQQKRAVTRAAATPAPKLHAGKPAKTARVKRQLPTFTFAPLIRSISRATPVLAYARTKSVRWLHLGLLQAQKAAKYSAITGSYYARKGWRIADTKSRVFWKWLRPHIEYFDRWLDRRLHQNDHAASLLSFGNEMAKTVKAWLAYVRVLKDKYLPLK